jgi:hypothetical protein
MKGIASFNTMGRKQQLLYWKSSLIKLLLGVAFGHRDIQAIPRQTYSLLISQRKNLFD